MTNETIEDAVYTDVPTATEPLELIEQSWSEVDDIFNSIATSIVDIGVNVNAAIGMLNTDDYKDNQELVTTVRGLSRDLMQFTDELKQIKERHQDRTGLINNEDELALSISVFSDYSVLSDRFRTVIFPPMITITEFLSEAAIKMNQSLPKEEQVDLDYLQPDEEDEDDTNEEMETA